MMACKNCYGSFSKTFKCSQCNLSICRKCSYNKDLTIFCENCYVQNNEDILNEKQTYIESSFQ